jgi:anhydro-N-acetylmuramic acid kinase
MDGVDAAIFRIIPVRSTSKSNGHAVPQHLDVEMLDALVYPFDPQLTKKMNSIVSAGRVSLDELVRLDAALGEVFAQAALAVMRKANVTKSDINLIGSHGQTIWHAPKVKRFAGVLTHGTLQLGQPSIIAARTGLPVIADFRTRDMADGGQGAPLVAFADEVLFASDGEAVGVLNIGGIANITVLDTHGRAVLAFDTGPGNVLIDRLCEVLFNKPFDDNGKFAAQGKPNLALVEEFLEQRYFHQAPPKTTGRELFSATYADELLSAAEKRKLSKHDTIATATALTALSIARAYENFIQPTLQVKKIVLGGGGAYNKTLLDMLKSYWPHQVKLETHEDYGVSTKFKEALLFALLAYTTHFGIPNNVPRCTGAKQHACLGSISRA